MDQPFIIAFLILKSDHRKEYEKWTAEFPVQDDCEYMDKTIQAAQERLNQEDKEFKSVKGIKISKKAQQKRERDALSEYVKDMKDYLKDLKCGVNVSPVTDQSSQSNAMTSSNAQSGSSDILSQAVVQRQPVKNSYAAQSSGQSSESSTPTSNQVVDDGKGVLETVTDKVNDTLKVPSKGQQYTKYVLIGLAVAAVAYIGYRVTRK